MKRYCEACGTRIEAGRFCNECEWKIEQRALVLAREWLKQAKKPAWYG